MSSKTVAISVGELIDDVRRDLGWEEKKDEWLSANDIARDLKCILIAFYHPQHKNIKILYYFEFFSLHFSIKQGRVVVSIKQERFNCKKPSASRGYLIPVKNRGQYYLTTSVIILILKLGLESVIT